MPLLPRSRRGTWLLAGAVWVAACAGLWWALPIVPRATIRLPNGSQFLGFCSESHCLLTVKDDSSFGGDWNHQHFAVETIDFLTGATLTVLNGVGGARICGSSPDGRFWIIVSGRGYFSRCHRFDAVTRTVRTLSIHEPTDSHPFYAVSADGKFWVCRDCVFDLDADRRLESAPSDQRALWEFSSTSAARWTVDVRYPQDGTVQELIAKLGITWRFCPEDTGYARVVDRSSGLLVGEIPIWDRDQYPQKIVYGMPGWASYAIGNDTLTAVDSGDHQVWNLWDIPPRKSLTLFACGAALFALPIGFVAWRRGRKLRAA